MSLPFSQQVTADATCQLLSAGSAYSSWIAVGSVLTGQVWGAVAGTAGTVAFEALGRASGCYNNPDNTPGFEAQKTYTGCKKAATGYLTVYATRGDEESLFDNISEVTNFELYTNSFTGDEMQRITYKIHPSGSTGSAQLTTDWTFDVRLGPDSTCGEPAPEPTYPVHQPGDPIAPPYEFYDEETQCAWKITATDSYLNSAGEPIFFWKATSNNPSKCGGPYQWWGNGQEPNIPSFEDPRGPDVPPRPPTLPPGPGDDLKDRLDRIEEQLDQLKECACPEKPVKEGDARTISFRSDETSPFGKSRLRKRFKYRSQSGLDLAGVVAHWRDFVWEAGPVAVWHSGSSLGSPKVWAATVDEGKRVIRHAGGEAGIDPDQVGEWGVSGSDNPRYGVSLEVGLKVIDGCWSATSRSGPDGYPEAAVV